MRKGFMRRRRLHVAVAVLAFGVAIPGGGAHASSSSNSYFDNFDSYTLGPLPGSLPTDNWESETGLWRVEQQQATDAAPTQDSNKILVQESKASTAANGAEPVTFVRAKAFHSFTAQVTAAMMDPQNVLGDLNQGASVGMVFRSPLTDGLADKDNLYLFSAIVTGVAPGFPTGKAYGLFKRVGRGYYPQAFAPANASLFSSTWADFTKPHDYKVVVALGHIQCFVDGRLVIDHTDIPSPDQATDADPFPGLPFDNGAVGLRTSGTRAWFDNFKVVGNDAYEARANLLDIYTNYGIAGTGGPQGSIRRGGTVLLSQQLGYSGLDPLDTGFVYSDSAPFENSVISPLVNPGDGQPLAGVLLGVNGAGDAATATARVSALNLTFTEPTSKVTVILKAKGLELAATASCTGYDSMLNFYDAVIYVKIASPDKSPDTVIGPFPLALSYKPNSVIFDKPGIVTITAHWRLANPPPNRVDVAALKISFPEGRTVLQAQTIGVQGTPVFTRTPETTMQLPPLEITLAQVVAGRYCP
jgi:hypothetical protein